MSFATPMVLLLMPLAALALIWRYRLRPPRRPALLVTDLGIIERAAGQGAGLRLRLRWLPAALRIAALFLLLIAAARPQRGLAITYIPEQGIDLVLALDMSSSMTQSTGPGQPTRLAAAKRAIRDFVLTLSGDRVGVVIFQARSLVLSPLTVDRIAVQRTVDHIEPGLLPDGTAIGLGAAEGLNLLRNSQARSRVLVLLTDGQNNSGDIQPLQAAQLAKTLGVRIYTIGFVPRVEDVDRAVLRKMATDTGGTFYDAATQAELMKAYAEIGALERSRVGERRFTRYQEIAPWLIGVALALLVSDAAVRATVFRRHP
jgi:Ca-activated chloride channel family protein